MIKLLSFLLILFLSVSQVAAQTPPNNQLPRGRNSNRPTQQNPQERHTQSVQQLMDRMFINFQNRLNLYEQFLTKLESRRATLAQKGADTTNLDRFLREARNNLATTKNVLNTTRANSANLDFTEPLPQLRRQVVDTISPLRQEFTQMHRTMSQVVNSINTLSQ